MSGNSRSELPSQYEAEGMRVLNTFRNRQLRSLTSSVLGMKCVRQHPMELQPRARAFNIINVKGLACHVLPFGSPSVKSNFMAITYEYDLFGGVNPGVFCLSVRRGASQVVYLFNPDLDNFAVYLKDQTVITDDFRIIIKQGCVGTIHYFPRERHLIPQIPILFFAHSCSEADLFSMYMMMRYAYYQYPKEGHALEGISDDE